MTNGLDDKSSKLIEKNNRQVLMLKAINKIHSIIDKEKRQKKSDKVHVLFILGALVISLVLTYVVLLLLDTMKVFVM